jgi:uncharacterized membrane protein YfcA
VFVTFSTLYWPAIVGLTLGGVVAAPAAAYLAKRVPARLVLGAVAVLIFALSARNTVTAIAQLRQPPDAQANAEAIVLNKSDSATGEPN